MDGTGIDIGINPRTTAANTVWTSGTTSINSTILVVISYEIVSGLTNDVVNLWINPTPGSSEPTATLTATNILTDLANLNRILIRQDSASATPFISMDELRIGTSWESVTPSTSGGTISSAGTTFPLTSLTTTYGTASASSEFFVSGTGLTSGITVTPPVGFEVSLTSDNFGATIGTNSSPLVVGAAGTVTSTSCKVRLAATAGAATNVTGNIVLSSPGASPVNVPLNATNSVSKKELYINGITADNKPFDNSTTATLSGIATATFTGIVNADEPNVVLDGTAYIANFNDATIGNNKPVTVLGFAITGSKAFCYNLNQPTGLTANITPSTLTPQTLTFNPLSDVTYGVGTVTLNATSDSSSGIPITYTISPAGIATLSGNVLTIIGAGTLTVTAKQAGNATYSPAVDVLQNLLVNKKTVTILNAVANNKLYDGTTTATITGTLNGVINSDVVDLNLMAHFDNANVGTNKPVTSTSTITNTDAVKYILVQPTGLTAAIEIAPCGATPGVITYNFATATPTSNTSSALVSDLTRANNNGTTTLITTTSASNGYVGASGAGNAGAAALAAPLDTATSAYFEFTLTPSAGHNVALNGISFGSRSTSTGPQAFTLRSNLDGYTSNVANGALLNNATWALFTPTLASTSSASPITYRLYGHSGTGSPATGTANWRIDDLVLNVAETLTAPLTSATTATACSGQTFNYNATTALSGATITWKRAAVVGISNAAVTTPQSSNPSEILVNTTGLPINVVYEFTVSNGNCYYIQNVTVTVNSCSSIVNLKLFVQGYYDGGTMRPVKFNQDGTSPTTDVENITVELHDVASPYAVLQTTTALLKTDGTAVCTFITAPTGSFYIAVSSSNAIKTWSATAQSVGGVTSYDFSTAATQAYGNNMVDLGSGVFGFYSGDINSDGSIDGTDAPNIFDDVDNSAFGIQVTDLNGDGSVDNSDVPYYSDNSDASIYSHDPNNP